MTIPLDICNFASTAAWLQQEYLARKVMQPSYSLRNFAKDLKIASGRLSEFLSGRRRITELIGTRIAKNLGYDRTARGKILTLIQKERAEHSTREPFAESGPGKLSDEEDDKRTLITDTLHFSLLSLLETEDFQNDVTWMAKRLGTRIDAVRQALNRLERLNFITKEPNGTLVAGSSPVPLSGIPAEAWRQAHQHNLEESLKSLTETDVSEREITSILVVSSAEKITAAKERIRAFRDELATFLEDGPREEVYRLNLQLIPTTKKV